MSWERISEADLGAALIATMRSERENLRVYEDDRSALVPEQVAQLVFGQTGDEFGYVAPYQRSIEEDAPARQGRLSGQVIRTDYYAVHSAMKVNPNAPEGDSERVFKQRLSDMRVHLEKDRSFGYGLHRVKHLLLQQSQPIRKQPSQVHGEFLYFLGSIAIWHKFTVPGCK